MRTSLPPSPRAEQSVYLESRNPPRSGALQELCTWQAPGGHTLAILLLAREFTESLLIKKEYHGHPFLRQRDNIQLYLDAGCKRRIDGFWAGAPLTALSSVRDPAFISPVEFIS